MPDETRGGRRADRAHREAGGVAGSMLMLPVLLAAIAPVRVATAPHIDGHLDDAVWTSVPASDSFTQSFPHDGAAPSDPTRVQVGYDDDNLYIAVDCVQHSPRLARLTRRDRDVD